MSKQNKMIPKSIGDKSHFLLMNGKPVAMGSGFLGSIFGTIKNILGFGISEGGGIYGSGTIPKEKRGGWLNFLLPVLGSIASSVIGNVINKKVNGNGMYGTGTKKLRIEIMNKAGEKVNLSKILKHADPTLTKALMSKGSGLFSKSGSGIKPLTQSQVTKLTGMGMKPKTKYMSLECNPSNNEQCGMGMYPSKGSGSKKNLKNAIVFD
jgi:hypothetical protein